MPRLCLEERNRLLGHLQAGRSPTEVAKLFGTSRRTVYSISAKYLEHGSLKDRPKSGRPRVTNDQRDEQIVATFTDMPMKQVLSFSAEVEVSARTVVRRLNSVGLYAHRPALKPKLTVNQKLNRLSWAKDHKRWNRVQWSNVLFSDEATNEDDCHLTTCITPFGRYRYSVAPQDYTRCYDEADKTDTQCFPSQVTSSPFLY